VNRNSHHNFISLLDVDERSKQYAVDRRHDNQPVPLVYRLSSAVTALPSSELRD
jgi:hypothetical protein